MIQELGRIDLVPACRRSPIREQLFRLPLGKRLGSRLSLLKAHHHFTSRRELSFTNWGLVRRAISLARAETFFQGHAPKDRRRWRKCPHARGAARPYCGGAGSMAGPDQLRNTNDSWLQGR